MTPPIVVTAFPKAGLHLLAQMLRPLGEPCPAFGGYYDERQLTTHERGGWGPALRPDADVLKDLNLLQAGQAGTGHLAATPAVMSFLEGLGWPVIFLYRDLRDVAVSMTYHIESRDHVNFPHPRKWSYQALPSHEARIRAVIKGYAGWPSLRDWWRQYRPWIGQPAWVHTVRYEDLRRNPNASAILILQYLRRRTGQGWDPAYEDHMTLGVSPAHSPTFRAGRIGDWEREFDEPLRQLARVHLE